MPFHVSADPGHRLVSVTYDGLTTLDHRARALAHGEALLRATGYRRILVDLRDAHSTEEPLDSSNAFATRLAQSEEVRLCRLAYVVPHHQHANRLIESMAVARHLEVERFEHPDEALAWLCCESFAPDLDIDAFVADADAVVD